LTAVIWFAELPPQSAIRERSAKMAKKKQTKRTTHQIKRTTHKLLPNPKYADDTPQDMAEGFSNLAKMIDKALDKYDHNQQNEEVDALFHNFRSSAIVLWERARHIGIVLDAVYTLTGKDNYTVLCRIREWCEKAAQRCCQNLTFRSTSQGSGHD
jgi:hypothetical protein